MPIMNVLASVAVNDLDTAVDWYSRLLGEPAGRPMPEVAEWQFDRGGWLQVYELPERAGTGSFTLAVTDIDEQARALRDMGITDAHSSSGARVKTLMIADPDGNHIAFAQALDPTLAQ
jgi:predicted enzyme related to lactoylglutathione lyase